MARKRRVEVEQESSGLNDTVEEVKKDRFQSPVKDRDSFSDDETEDTVTAPSPNVSDFIIKTIVTERSPTKEGGGQAGLESKRKKLMETTSVVLGLPKQNVNAKKKLVSHHEREVKGKLEDEVGPKRLSELLKLELLKAGKAMETDLSALDVGMDVLKEHMGGFWSDEKDKEMEEKKKKWQQQRLELYIKKLELVQEHTKLVLDELVSQNK